MKRLKKEQMKTIKGAPSTIPQPKPIPPQHED